MIGVYGGTFNPIHYGHLRTALDVLEQLSLSKVLMVPSAQPPHRDLPQVSIDHRWQMLILALAGQEQLVADDREIKRKGPSYTFDTLVELRQVFADQPLCLIQGSDVFLSLHTWHRWQELLEFAHIVVISRGNEDISWSEEVEREYGQHKTEDFSQLQNNKSGCIIQLDVTGLEISATLIRQKISTNESIRYLLPDSVAGYIEQHGLYKTL